MQQNVTIFCNGLYILCLCQKDLLKKKFNSEWKDSVSHEEKKYLEDWETLADFGEFRKTDLQSVAIINV